MKKINYRKLLIYLLCAPVYGAVFWMFLESIQPEIVNQIYNCNYCERCANILYDREQVVLAFCAALACFGLGFIKTKGFRGVLKTIGVNLLAFQVYSLLTIRSVILAHECTALHRERSFPIFVLIILLISTAITSAVWAGICAVPFVVFNIARALAFSEKDDDLQRLDLGLR